MKLGELDLHLAGEGRHERIYERLGAHMLDQGVSFAVWAPNARAVSVIGDWNHWDRSQHPLRRTGDVWQAVIPAGRPTRWVIEADGHAGPS